MKFVIVLLIITSAFSFGAINLNQKDYYYDNYDFNPSFNNTKSTINRIYARADTLILPAPKIWEETKSRSKLKNDDVVLPDDSLISDPDLQDHDFIDNLMYVYYGSKSKNHSIYGAEVIVIGSVLSCAAQLLTIFCILLKKNQNGRKENSKIFLHLTGCMCLSNLMFMLGVHATKNVIKCKIVAVFLHYLHLSTSFWIFFYCNYIHRQISRYASVSSPNRKIYFLAYGLPSLFSLTSVIIIPDSYETKKFCFVSIERGMIMNYMFPISCLIIATTFFSLNGIRRINLELSKLDMASSGESLNILKNEMLGNDSSSKSESSEINEEATSLKECKSCFKQLCLLQTCFGIVWFLAVTALENAYTGIGISISYAVFSSILNWYVLLRLKKFIPSVWTKTPICMTLPYFGEKEKDCAVDKKLKLLEASDDIPLLPTSDNSTDKRNEDEEFEGTVTS